MNHGDVVWAQEVMVAVRNVDRRAKEVGELGLMTLCLGLSQPFGQTHSSGRARLGCRTNFLQWLWKTHRVLRKVPKVRTTHEGTDDMGRSTKTPWRNMSAGQCE